MKMIVSSIWVLYKNFFDAVPGQKGLLAIGFLLMALGYFQLGSNNAELFIMAGTAFVSGFTLLFAGPQFRKLASFRRHRLLPNFRMLLIISYLMTLISLSLLILIGLHFLDQKKLVQLIQLNDISTVTIYLSILSLVLIVSLFGFLPGYLRYPFWLLLIIGLVKFQNINHLPVEILLLSIIGIAMIGLCCFMYFFGIIKKPILYSKQTVSLSKYLPGLNGSFQEKGVTAVGSILLGMSDGNTSRFFRAFFTVFLLPIALACAALLTDKYSAEQFFQNSLFLLISLMTAVMIQIHFVFAVSARRRFIWLRVGGSRQQINQVAQKVLARERWSMVFCFGLWCVPILIFYPKVAVWLLGVSTLLWFMMIFLEQIIINLKNQLTQRAEFYLLLSFISMVMSIIALAHIHQQSGILWFGAMTIFSLYLAQKLSLKAKSKSKVS